VELPVVEVVPSHTNRGPVLAGAPIAIAGRRRLKGRRMAEQEPALLRG
jgi:hypothetical protein